MPKLYSKGINDFDDESKARKRVAKFITYKSKTADKSLGTTKYDADLINSLNIALTSVKQDLIKITNRLQTQEDSRYNVNIGSIITNIFQSMSLAKKINFNTIPEEDLNVIKDFIDTFESYKDILDTTLTIDGENELGTPSGKNKQAGFTAVKSYEQDLYKLINLLKSKVLNYKSNSGNSFIPDQPKETYFNPSGDTPRASRDSQEFYKGLGFGVGFGSGRSQVYNVNNFGQDVATTNRSVVSPLTSLLSPPSRPRTPSELRSVSSSPSVSSSLIRRIQGLGQQINYLPWELELSSDGSATFESPKPPALSRAGRRPIPPPSQALRRPVIRRAQRFTENVGSGMIGCGRYTIGGDAYGMKEYY